MSFITVGLGEGVKEPEALPEAKYALQIADVQTGAAKSGAPMFTLIINFLEFPDAPSIWHYVVLPKEDDDEKAVSFKLLNLKRFLTVVGIPFSDEGFNDEDLMGAMFDCDVGVGEPTPEYPDLKNELRLPKLEG